MSASIDSFIPAWQLVPVPDALVADLARELGLPGPVARVLAGLGLHADHVERYLQPRLADLTLPDAMAGLGVAVERVARAVEAQEPIGVFGDYDVDGVTATALVGDYLRRCGANLQVRVARRDEGYGFGTAQARELVDRGCSLIVLADCGTSDNAAVELVVGAGRDVIAVDHHRLAVDEPWPGLALVNPQRPDCKYPYKGLCSAGLAFYLMAGLRRALQQRGRSVPDPRENLDLVALGTIADVAPLDGENRILVRKGLEQLARTDRPGLRELMRLSAVDGKAVSSDDVSWRLAPRLNAPGRLGDASVALDCLLLRDPGAAEHSARRCHALNEERKALQSRILAEALQQAQQRDGDPFCIVAGEGWNPGVIGIVAAKLSDLLRKPTAVVAWEGAVGRASARSIAGVDLFDLLRQSRDHLQRFGGHSAAAGFTVSRAQLELLRESLGLAARRAAAQVVQQRLRLHAIVELASVDDALCQALQRLAPYGQGNPQPVFAAGAVQVEAARVVGQDHLALALRQGHTVRQAIGFGMASKQPPHGARIDVAFTPEIDDYLGPRVRLRMVDLTPAGVGIPTEEIAHE